jgi:hypothetical protein
MLGAKVDKWASLQADVPTRSEAKPTLSTSPSVYVHCDKLNTTGRWQREQRFRSMECYRRAMLPDRSAPQRAG